MVDPAHIWRVKDAKGEVHEAPIPVFMDAALPGERDAFIVRGGPVAVVAFSARGAVARWADRKKIDWTEIVEPGQLFASEQVEAERERCAEHVAQIRQSLVIRAGVHQSIDACEERIRSGEAAPNERKPNAKAGA